MTGQVSMAAELSATPPAALLTAPPVAAEGIMHLLKLATWNVKGLRKPEAEGHLPLSHPASLGHIIVLQKTHFHDLRDAHKAQREWAVGCSLWSSSPNGQGDAPTGPQ